MAYPYNNYFNPYQPMYTPQPAPDQLNQLRQPYQQMQMPQSPAKADERIFVQGKDAALAYLVAPNSFVRLWDSTSNQFYEKSADASGRPTMETFEYRRKAADVPNTEPTEAPQGKDYEKELEALRNRIAALEAMMKEATHEQSDADD